MKNNQLKKSLGILKNLEKDGTVDKVIKSMRKEKINKEQKLIDFFKSNRFIEIIKKLEQLESREINYFTDLNDDLIFLSKEEFNLFCDSVLFKNKHNTFNGITYFNNYFSIKTLYGQGDFIHNLKKLKDKVSIRRSLLFKDKEGEHGVVIFEHGKHQKIEPYGNKDKIIKHLYNSKTKKSI